MQGPVNAPDVVNAHCRRQEAGGFDRPRRRGLDPAVGCLRHVESDGPGMQTGAGAFEFIA
ncbi:MAG: hypothetical protein OXJ64_13230 [Boseongicola sp.]|nr:hypothetical protein [Boseongicola sp.]